MLAFEKKVKEIVEKDVAPCPVPGCDGKLNKVKLAHKASVLFAIPLGTYGSRDAMCCPVCNDVIFPNEDGQYPQLTIAAVPQKA